MAPLLFKHCSTCHRPGQSGKFSLLSYADAKPRAGAILESCATRYMPLWLPDGPAGEFTGDRRLTDGEIDLLRRWVADGAIEGDASDLPPSPKFSEDWPLGKPDLVVTLPQTYSLAEQGKDIYRNFVLPLGMKERRHVRALDMRPGSAAVHHGFLAFDRYGKARRWDARDEELGFASFTLPPGLDIPNHFLGWHPGKRAVESPPGLAWALEPRSDLVLQLHMRPTGRGESVAPQVAFYFTSEAPTNEPIKFQVSTIEIAIPAGASNHVVRSSMPVMGDADLLAVAPHAHFLAKKFTGRVRFPDGTSHTLLHIPRWEFNWQDSYRYAKPLFLPAGSVVEMEIVFDNSAANPNNPHWPPKQVDYGIESTDEMAVFSVQILPRSREAADRELRFLAEDTTRYMLAYNSYLLRREPTNALALVGMGRALYQLGQLAPALEHVVAGRRLDPLDDDAACLHGILLQFKQQPIEARAAAGDDDSRHDAARRTIVASRKRTTSSGCRSRTCARIPVPGTS